MATTTLFNLVCDKVGKKVTLKEESDCVNLIAGIYDEQQRIGSVYKSFDENFKPIFIMRFNI